MPDSNTFLAIVTVVIKDLKRTTLLFTIEKNNLAWSVYLHRVDIDIFIVLCFL